MQGTFWRDNLTPDDVRMIQRLHNDGHTVQELVEIYEVCPDRILEITAAGQPAEARAQDAPAPPPK